MYISKIRSKCGINQLGLPLFQPEIALYGGRSHNLKITSTYFLVGHQLNSAFPYLSYFPAAAYVHIVKLIYPNNLNPPKKLGKNKVVPPLKMRI